MNTHYISGLAAAAVVAGSLALAGPAPSAHAEEWVSNGLISGFANDAEAIDVTATGVGDAVAVWNEKVGSHRLVYARESVDGQWVGDIKLLSGPEVSTQHLEVVSAGSHVVALWTELIDNKGVLFGARRTGAGTWGQPKQLTSTDWHVTEMDGAVDASGRVLVGTTSIVEGFARAKVVDWQPGPGIPVVEDWGLSIEAVVDMTPSGRAVLVYNEAVDDDYRVATRAPGSDDWSAAKTLKEGNAGTQASVDVNDAGEAIVAFEHVLNGFDVISHARVHADGTVSSPTQVSPGSMDSQDPSVSINAAGQGLTTWSTLMVGENIVGYNATTAAGSGSTNWLNPAGNEPMKPQSAITPNGTTVVAIASDDALQTYHRLPGKSWVPSGAGIADLTTPVSVDPAGHVVVVTADNDPVGGVGARWFDATAPTAAVAVPAVTLSTTVPVSFSAADQLMGVQQVDLLATTASFKGLPGAASVAKANAPGTQFAFTGKAGSTYCFQARAVDNGANTATSAPDCTTLPVDDRSLKGKKGWTKAKSSSHYLGTVLKTNKLGKTLSLKNVKARSLALVVAKSKSGGKVKVWFAGKAIRTVKLAGKGKKVVVPLKTFGSIRTGTLKLRTVGASPRLVQIDGVVVGK